MRVTARLVLLAAVAISIAAALAAPAAADQSPTADRNWKPSGQIRSQPEPLVSSTLELINDGSFENGPPPASAWAETTTTVCEWIVDPSGVFGVPAYDGTYAFWAGGYCPLGVPNTDWVTQQVLVPAPLPADATNLSFWYLCSRLDPDDENLDVAHISINGTDIWTLEMTMANDTGSQWVNEQVDISAYAGQSVALELGGTGVGFAGNLLFDYLQWVVEPPVGVGDVPGPTLSALGRGVPNPFAQETKLSFQLSQPERVSLLVYDVNGRRVRTLADDVSYPAGHHGVVWDGRDDAGARVAAGVYTVRLAGTNFSESRTIVRLD